MKVAIVTDAWLPQVNGVVTTLRRTGSILERLGHAVHFVTPAQFRTLPCPTYPEIRLSIGAGRGCARLLEAAGPDAVHVATEGPLGLAARRWCLRGRRRFTTSYHTQFPQYLRARAPVPLSWSYAYLRWFHAAAERIMVSTEHQRRDLLEHGFSRVAHWGRGVDAELFRPYGKSLLGGPRPIFMYMGRVAVEKNVEAFLRLELPGSKYVVGGGPDLEMLRGRYPDVVFLGFKYGEELARHVAAADVLVFPSRSDTFGLVLLEAMACGVPVAAYPVTGPLDVVAPGTGVLDEDLGRAALAALALDPQRCREHALQHTWEAATQQFLSNLAVD